MTIQLPRVIVRAVGCEPGTFAFGWIQVFIKMAKMCIVLKMLIKLLLTNDVLILIARFPA